jgi:nucleoside-diphosphate-sugar epimerase
LGKDVKDKPGPAADFTRLRRGRRSGRQHTVRQSGGPTVAAPGDVVCTWADTEASRRDLGFEPKTPIEQDLPRFVARYREYRGM